LTPNRPHYTAIIFGLSFATVLTLGIVPVLYSLFFRVSFRDFEPRVVTTRRRLNA